MALSLSHVLSAGRIGPVDISNRVVRTGHGTGLGGGTMSDALIDYHAARARGGVGLTILELVSVHHSAYPFLRAGAPGLVAGYGKLMAAVRPHGMRVFQQIGHLGNEIPQADGGPPMSASDSIGAMVGVRATPMTRRQIAEVIDCYMAAAQDCVAGGLDGVELHMAHGYLVQQFLSPLYNRRTDEYGGSFVNRTRLAVELLTTVRQVLPAHMALGVRLSSEAIDGGMGPEDVTRVARLFADKRLIDYVNLTIGTDYNPHKIIGAMHEPMGYEMPYAAPVKRAIPLPILVTGRFRTLEEANQVIGAGAADFVALTRAHIADPDIVRKTREGRVEEVRPCIGCNHGCIGGLLSQGRIGCAVNVAVGAERDLAEDLIRPVAEPRRVLVVGGGPAGLEAARVAALRGHHVTLAEASSALGGSVRIAARAPRRIGLGDITDWLEREVYRLGVDVRLSSYMDAADVHEMAPDAVIVATGSLPALDGRQMFLPGHQAEGMGLPHVVSSHDLLLGPRERNWGRKALVFDDVGHYEAVAAAEFLLSRGLEVTFATSHGSFAHLLEPALSAFPALERLGQGAFRLMTYARLDRVEQGGAVLRPRYGGAALTIHADLVVFVSHNISNRDLVDELEDYAGRVIAVGDAQSPRFLQTAIREGHLAARGIV